MDKQKLDAFINIFSIILSVWFALFLNHLIIYSSPGVEPTILDIQGELIILGILALILSYLYKKRADSDISKSAYT